MRGRRVIQAIKGYLFQFFGGFFLREIERTRERERKDNKKCTKNYQ